MRTGWYTDPSGILSLQDLKLEQIFMYFPQGQIEGGAHLAERSYPRAPSFICE